MRRFGRMWALLLCLALLAGCAAEEPLPPTAEPAAAEETAATEATADPTPEPAPESAPQPEEQELVLWLAEDAPFYEELSTLAGSFSVQREDLAVRVVLFEKTGQMLESFPGEAPDLLFCSGRDAAALAEEGRLASLPLTDSALLPLFLDAPGFASGGYFPLGAELPVLAFRESESARLEGCRSLESLCAAAAAYARETDRAFFSADDFSRLFACALRQKGVPFRAEHARDVQSEGYCELYNLLAECAFDGGLAPMDQPVLTYVAEGELVAGLCSSRDLLLSGREGLAVLPAPPLEGCEDCVDAEYWGLAALTDNAAAAEWIASLYAGDLRAETVLAEGWLPAAEGDWGAGPGAASEGLQLALRACRSFTPEPGSDYLLRGRSFEEEYRAALALIS